MDTEAASYNALALHHYGDYRKLAALYRQYRNWSAACTATSSVSATRNDAWQKLKQRNIQLLLRDDPSFPPLLREIPWAPHAIYLRGAPIHSTMHVAIVGTRKATKLGIETAGTFARECTRAGLTIVSGLAFGIDAAAHQATLAATGRAIAVLGSGIDNITPHSNERLGKAILESGGTLISEYPIGTTTLAHFFIERNRIVSGLCKGIIVIEAPARSGTLSTARFATEQNREVFVVPGSITNPNFTGSHALIQSGATLVTNTADIFAGLGLATPTLQSQNALPFLDEQSRRIVELLSSSDKPLSIDQIAERTKLGTSIINESLALLTIEGVAKEDSGAYYI